MNRASATTTTTTINSHVLHQQLFVHPFKQAWRRRGSMDLRIPESWSLAVHFVFDLAAVVTYTDTPPILFEYLMFLSSCCSTAPACRWPFVPAILGPRLWNDPRQISTTSHSSQETPLLPYAPWYRAVHMQVRRRFLYSLSGLPLGRLLGCSALRLSCERLPNRPTPKTGISVQMITPASRLLFSHRISLAYSTLHRTVFILEYGSWCMSWRSIYIRPQLVPARPAPDTHQEEDMRRNYRLVTRTTTLLRPLGTCMTMTMIVEIPGA